MYNYHEGYQRLLGTDINGLGDKTKGIANSVPMKDIMDLTGKTAIVTGGAMGLGSCVINRLAEAGANIVIADVAEEYAEKLLEFCISKNYNVKFVKTDVRYVNQIKNAVNFTLNEFGTIDILVNNASVWSHKTLSELTEESWEETLNVNLKGAVFFIKEVAKVMENQGKGGKIINIASVAGLSEEPAPVMFDYVASKSGLIAVTKSMSRALKPIDINLNCVIPGGMITPGAVNTPVTEKVKEIRKNMKSVPAEDPDMVARVVYMMATNISDYMYGSTIIADGGAYLNME
ncbi:SDR family NAD(P)-dependent oxidoreductase [Sporosalibacterium faouarense]|uniref:SDR family NAD(P)-dependent oxidoreductase n=1 Tax=Sporosalibacterium faouarense TaxID=516123 RepID=UPI00141D1877|nr:SDR family oxidoreductase [Sporosalibacterium faouarense]MTI48447.1 SDR family oxidoreductase [Bacillota bacterium]